MSEYIDREQLLELINENCKYKNPTNEYTRGCNEVCDWAIKTIKNIPTADVQEVRHGKWIVKDLTPYCSVCHRPSEYECDGVHSKPLFCPNCGAKLDVKEAEAENKEVEEKK